MNGRSSERLCCFAKAANPETIPAMTRRILAFIALASLAACGSDAQPTGSASATASAKAKTSASAQKKASASASGSASAAPAASASGSAGPGDESAERKGKMANCPNAAPNAKTELKDTPKGIEILVSATEAKDVEEIRRRAKEISDKAKGEATKAPHTGNASVSPLTKPGRPSMLTDTPKWSHARGNEMVPSRWQATRTGLRPNAIPASKRTFGLGCIWGSHSGVARKRQGLGKVGDDIGGLEYDVGVGAFQRSGVRARSREGKRRRTPTLVRCGARVWGVVRASPHTRCTG